MSVTARQLNWTEVESASTNLTRVTSVMFAQGGQLLPFFGDNNKYPVVIAIQSVSPMCSITSSDVATVMGIEPGTGGTIVATQVDALNYQFGRRHY
jgi:hypothetical protein